MRLLFVLECGPGVGLGHLMRCRALMREAGARGWTYDLLVRGEAGGADRWDWPGLGRFAAFAAERPAAEFFRLVEQGVREGDYRWVVLDGYGLRPFTLAWDAAGAGVRTLVLDDLGDCPLRADLLLNQNTEDAALYGPETAARGLLLGPGYALVGPEWREARARWRLRPEPARVVVTFGGLDRGDWTATVLALLAEAAPGVEVDAVLGPFYRGRAEAVAGRGGGVRLHRGLGDLSPLLAQADGLVCGAGSTVWQACCVGLPMLAVATVDNQRAVLSTLARAGAALCLDGRREGLVAPLAERLLHAPTRAALSAAAAALVDGQGPARVLDRLLTTAESAG